MKSTLAAAVLAASGLFASPAMAISTFNLFDRVDPGACTQNASSAGSFGNSYACSQAGSTADELTVSAFSNTGSGAKFAAANLADYSSSGFGVRNTVEGLCTGCSPQHGMDNNGQLDLMLFSFDSSIALSSMKLGWTSTDSDVTVLAWTGAGDATAALTGSSTTSLLSSGWSLVGSYENLGTTERAINAGGVSSSYWLISAYNSTIGGSAWTEGNDYVKLQVVSGTFTCPPGTPGCGGGGVPEPATLALAGMALLGVVGSRRRRGVQVAA